MKISLIIPAYNEEKYIGACLTSVEKYGKEFFEVIVINNASTDKTADIARNFSFVRVIDEPKKGRPYARARGLSESRGELVAYIDADCCLSSNWFDIIFKEFNKDKKLVALSGPVRYHDLSVSQYFFAQALIWISIPITYRIVGYTILAGNFVAKKEILLKAGGFDENLLFYGDDADLARRMSYYGKVKFRMNFFVYTSGRRIINDGFLKTYFLYAINFVWAVIFKRPFTKLHNEIN